MTLKSRNRFFVFLFVFSLAFSFLNFFLLFHTYSKGLWTTLEFRNAAKVVEGGTFFSYSFRSVLLSILFFSFSAPFLSFILYWRFEKTPSIEVFFLSSFVISCMIEGCRLWILDFSLWNYTSHFFLALARLLLGGKLFGVMGILCACAFKENENRQNAEKNYLILTVASFGIASIYPVNTDKLLPNCMISYGFTDLFSWFTWIIAGVSVLILVVDGITDFERWRILKPLGLLLMMTGYFILGSTDSWFDFMVSLILCFSGCTVYLRSIHWLMNN